VTLAPLACDGTFGAGLDAGGVDASSTVAAPEGGDDAATAVMNDADVPVGSGADGGKADGGKADGGKADAGHVGAMGDGGTEGGMITTGGPPLIQGPLNGATPGTWQLVNYSGNGVSTNYLVLLPYNYSTANSYPLLVYLHENGYGNDGTGQFLLYTYESQGEGADIWFNVADFRTNWPCIVVCPLLIEDQDSTGNTQNWGGWGGPDPQPSQLNVVDIVKTLIGQYSVYTPKIYVTGDSLGGIGTWEFMIQYNSRNGLTTDSRLFAAGWSESGGTLLYGDPPSSSVVAELTSVPVFAVRGQQDNSTGPNWDPELYTAFGGGTPDGTKAPNGQFWYNNAAGLGHDVWFTYRNLTPSFGSTDPATAMYNWLFSQASPTPISLSKP
jgi:hypothetical protein